jgi:hypothetical protein
MARLLQTGRIEEVIHFAPEQEAKLTYALEHAVTDEEISVRCRPQEVTVVLSTEGAHKWAAGNQVGVHGIHKVGDGELELLVEKDFACLDKKDADNEDTFANPNSGAIC